MKSLVLYVVLFCCIVPVISCRAEPEKTETIEDPAEINETNIPLNLDEILAARRSNRNLSPEPLDRETALKLLWAGQGITDAADGKRTAPSAFAKYLLTLYYCDETGVYEYDPAANELLYSTADDIRPAISAISSQKLLEENGAVIVIAADMGKAESTFVGNAERFVYIEVGHAAQNLLLKATDLGLACCPVGGFDMEKATETLGLKDGYKAIYIIAVGYPG